MKEPIEVTLVITEITKHISFFDFEESEERECTI